MQDELIGIGKVGRPHGVRGEVRVLSHNPDSDLWHAGMKVTWRLAGKPAQEIVLRTIRVTPKGLLVTIPGFADRDGVNKLMHGELCVPRAELPPAETGEYYHIDVIGAVVFDADDGARLGTVTNIGQTNVDVLEITLDAGGEVLLPVIADYVISIGEQAGRVEVRNLDHWRD